MQVIGKYMNVEEAAAEIGVTTGRVRQMLQDGTLKGVKANSRAWLVDSASVRKIRDAEYKTGRPRTVSRETA